MDRLLAQSLWQEMNTALYPDTLPRAVPLWQEPQGYASAFAVSELAATSMGLATQAVAELIVSPHPVSVNVRLASRWFSSSFKPLNRPPAELWDAFAGDYAGADGWIRLHTNAPHHRAAMEAVLGKSDHREQLAERVAQWRVEELEQLIVEAGGCAAVMRSAEEWQRHPQGQAVQQEALIQWHPAPAAKKPHWLLPPARPLLGIKVLDLTRIIAGPVATRFLAGLGAEVLRIDPPGWQEPSLDEEITCGKRRAVLDLKRSEGLQHLRQLLAQADVLVHGYRADALERLGLDAEERQRIAPGLVDISLNAWGWNGPWRNRRGFDSLVQMGCGIAEAGMHWSGNPRPTPLPVQALDHATGYLMAAAALQGLRQRQIHGHGSRAQLSLARTAHLLIQHPSVTPASGITAKAGDALTALELTPWGIGERLHAATHLPGTAQIFSRPGSLPGSSNAQW
ncbi:CoA transferase [Pantoea sp. A4]|uniref:CoA transferase n=1 Tax=Pantoea sp. A4 TaxID=1225184 RepID=UPI0003730FE7|nr:CoA transferase [Pantoea sp. A4]